jgi:branched-chain amino acid transport system ATP-binding protein
MKAGRILVASGARLAGFPLFLLTFTIGNTPLMLVCFAFAAMCLIAPQAPLNAARADVLHPRLRGRGTSMDIVLQSSASAIAPIVVGILSDAYGLRAAFLIVLPLMLISGLILLLAVATYIREERALRREIRREALGSDEVGDDESGERREGETFGQAALRLARTGPTVAEGGDLLVIEDLDVSYGAIQVLFDASLRVPGGGVHALVGRNGVGKLGITLMSAGRSIFPTLTVEENLWMGAFPFHEERDLVSQRLDAVLDVFPAMRLRLSQTGGTLSGGEQQMVSLARALMAGPRLLLVDELSIGLAPLVTRDLLAVVRRIKELGTTVVIVEQSVSNALSVADTVTFMDKGVLVPVGNAADLGDGQVLIDMMMGGTAK